MAAKPIPDGYPTATPYLFVRGAAGAIEFYARAFGAREVARLSDPGGKVGHAEIRIGNSPVMLADEFPEMGIRGPRSFGGTPFCQLDLLRAVGFRAVEVLHRNGCFAAFGAVKEG